MHTSLSIIIPAHNEGHALATLLPETAVIFQNRPEPFEIVLVDDHSSDGTEVLLSSMRAQSPWLRVIRTEQQSGQSAALCYGIRAARYPLIATLDGDGQNNPADLPHLLESYHLASRLAPDVLIIGCRAQRQDSWLRKFSSLVANGLRSRVLGDRTPDSGCGIKVFAKETFLRLPAFQHMHRFLPALFLQHGGRVHSVTVSHRRRELGASHYGTLDRLAAGLVDLPAVYWLGRRTIPPFQQHNKITEEMQS